MLIIHRRSHYLPDKKTPGLERQNNTIEVPDGTSARKRPGMITISSIGLSPSKVWRDRMVLRQAPKTSRSPRVFRLFLIHT